MPCTVVWPGWSACRFVLIAKNDFLIASLECLVSSCLFSFGVASSKTPKYSTFRIHQVFGEEVEQGHCCPTKENPMNQR